MFIIKIFCKLPALYVAKFPEIWKNRKFSKKFQLEKMGKIVIPIQLIFITGMGVSYRCATTIFLFLIPPLHQKNFAPREISSRILKYKYSKTINIPQRDKKQKEERKNWFRPDFSTAFETVQNENRKFHFSTS